ncbi:MAG: cytochrome PufQ [Pseudomonadota bacterium]
MTVKQKRSEKIEYWVYFTLIFIAAIPFAFSLWVWRMIAPREGKQNRGVIRRAREQAHTVTPMIFSV